MKTHAPAPRRMTTVGAVAACAMACGGSASVAPPPDGSSCDAVAGGCSDGDVGPPPTGAPQWSQRAGDGLDQFGYAVAIDGAGNVFIAGEFGGTMDLGGGPLSVESPAIESGYLAKFDAHGRHLWSRKIGGSAGFQAVYALAVDPAGNPFVAGYFDTDIDCGGGVMVSAGSSDAWVAKYDRDGKHLFSFRYGDPMSQSVTGIALDRDGGFALAGDFDGTIDLGGGALATAGWQDIWVARFDAKGKHLWSKRYGAADNDWRPRVAFDSAGALVVTGTYRNQVDFGGGLLPDRYDGAFLLKLSKDGGHVFSKSFDCDLHQFPGAMLIDATDRVVMSGRFKGWVDFGGGSLTSDSGEDGFIATFDDLGAHQWSRRFGGFGQDAVPGVAVDATGNVYYTGEFAESFEGLVSAGNADLVIGKLDPLGHNVWVHGWGDPVDQRGVRIAVDSAGHSVTTGSFFGFLDFKGAGRLASAGGIDPSGGDVFFVRLDP